MSRFSLRSGFEADCDDVSRETGVSCDPDEEVTQQSFREECDINVLVTRFGLVGGVGVPPVMPTNQDFSDAPDFLSAMLLMRQAQEGFASLSADLRARFEHDPSRLLAFLEDSSNRDEAIKLGLVAKPVERTRDVVQAVDELAAKLDPPSKA